MDKGNQVSVRKLVKTIAKGVVNFCIIIFKIDKLG